MPNSYVAGDHEYGLWVRGMGQKGIHLCKSSILACPVLVAGGWLADGLNISEIRQL